MQTLLLDTIAWDLVLDAAGNIAVASEPYSLAQDAASACRLFEGELWYDTTQGIPYFQQVLGQMPPLALMKAYFTQAAFNVPDVARAQVFIADIGEDRALTGQVQIISANQLAVVNFVQAVFDFPPTTDTLEPLLF